MKKLFIVFGAVILLVLVGAIGLIGYAAYNGIPSYEPKKPEFSYEYTPERIAEGERIVNTMCKNCHLNRHSGKLTGEYLKEIPSDFGVLFSKNITQHKTAGIGSWTDGELAYFLRAGINPKGEFSGMMPRLHMYSDEDLASVIAFLRSDHPMVRAEDYMPPRSDFSLLSKVLANYVVKPMAYPTEPVIAPHPSDKVNYGRYLVVAKWDCFSCHSTDFKTINNAEPEKTPGFLGGGNTLIDSEGNEIFSANLTFDETGLAGWSEQDFNKAVKFGMTKKGALRYPMVPFVHMTDEEISAMYTYLKRVPKLKNEVDRKRNS